MTVVTWRPGSPPSPSPTPRRRRLASSTVGLGGEEEGEGEGGRSARMMHCMHIPDSLVARVPNMNQVRM